MNPTDGAQPWPDGLHLDQTDSSLILTVRWRNLTAWALLPMALVATGFAITIGAKLRAVPWTEPIQLIPLIFGLVAVGLLGFVIRRLVNVTRLHMSPDKFTISHGPLPWWRQASWPTATIHRLEVRPSRWRYNGRVVTHHHLWAVQHDGTEICLLARDTTEEQACRVRDELQRFFPVAPAAAAPRAA